MTTKEAEELIEILKKLVTKRFDFPILGSNKEFEIKGIDNPRFKFIFCINRKVKANPQKCTYIVRDKNSGINLLRLDIGAAAHKNPDGKKIIGPHLHIYKEEYNYTNNIPYAIEFDIANESLVQNCIAFLERFNVIERPIIFEQDSLLA